MLVKEVEHYNIDKASLNSFLINHCVGHLPVRKVYCQSILVVLDDHISPFGDKLLSMTFLSAQVGRGPVNNFVCIDRCSFV